MENTVYKDLFDGPESVINSFDAPKDALEGATVYFAAYQYEDYSGYATVVFEKDGKLFEVHGAHCSCYGLEGQWQPEETTWAAIAIRPDHELVELAKTKLATI